MRIHALVCTEDAQVLLSLAGITATQVHTTEQLQLAYEQAAQDPDIAILAVSERLLSQLIPSAGHLVTVPLHLEAS